MLCKVNLKEYNKKVTIKITLKKFKRRKLNQNEKNKIVRTEVNQEACKCMSKI